MRLSDIAQDTILPTTSHARYPGAHCAFFGVAGMAPLIKNSVALMIGPAVCLYNAKLTVHLRALTSDPRPDNLLPLLLDQEDIIFGAHDKIRRGIIEADRRHRPEALFVVSTCTQEIVGEDLDAVVKEAKPHVDARLLVVHTDNFSCEDAAPGIERTYLSLADLMRPGKIEARSVNLIGLRAPGGRKTEMVRLLEEKGVRIRNVIPSYSSVADISRAPESSLNIAVEHYALPLALKMAKEFGTPNLFAERPYTPDAMEDWYRGVAEAVGVDLGSEISALKKSVYERIRELRPSFEGKTVTLGVHPGRAFDFARLLVQLGMRPLLLYAGRILPHDLPDIQALLKDGVDPMVLKSGDALESDRRLSELRPDFHIGHSDRRMLARLGIEARSVLRAYGTTGFAGIQQVLKLLARPQAGSDILRFKEQYIRTAERMSPCPN